MPSHPDQALGCVFPPLSVPVLSWRVSSSFFEAVYVYIYICIIVFYIYTHVCIHKHIYVHTYFHTYIHMRMYIHRHVYVYTCIYIYYVCVYAVCTDMDTDCRACVGANAVLCLSFSIYLVVFLSAISLQRLFFRVWVRVACCTSWI